MKDLLTTKISWNDTDEVPKEGEPIICYTANGNIMTIKNPSAKDRWKWYVEKYNLVLWCYQVHVTVQLAASVFNALGGALGK